MTLDSPPHLSPDPGRVVQVVLVVGQLADAVVHGDAALPRGHLLLGYLHPAQGAHRKHLVGGGERGRGGRERWREVEGERGAGRERT